MFVDYSGLQRFSSINKSFGKNYLLLLHYDTIDSIGGRLQELQKTEKTVQAIQLLAAQDVEGEVDAVNFLFKLAISVKQMVGEFDVIKRCPTLYAVDLLDERDHCVNNTILENDNDTLRQATKELYTYYEMVRRSLCEEVKKLILDLRPSDNIEDFDQLHVLQKCLFYENCPNISKYIIPKIDIVIIPVSFPAKYIEKVNNDGFINGGTNLNFSKFDLDLASRSLSDIMCHNLFLKRTCDKISTIWKDEEAKDFIGTFCELNDRQKGKKSLELCKEPKFASLFKELFPEMADIHIPPTAIDNSESNRSNKNGSQFPAVGFNSTFFASASRSGSGSESESAKASLYDIFSPLSSNNLPSTVTPADTDVPIIRNKKIKHDTVANLTSVTSKNDILIFPPPPSLLSPYEDFETYPHSDKHPSLKEKFKRLLSKPANRYFSLYDQKKSGFDTVGSLAEFQSDTWNEMTSKKFLRFKYRKFKRNCRYFKDVAKQCFEDFQDASLCQN